MLPVVATKLVIVNPESAADIDLSEFGSELRNCSDLNGKDLTLFGDFSSGLIRKIESSGVGFAVTGHFFPKVGRGLLTVGDSENVLLEPVSSLRLSVRPANCLHAAGIATVGELAAWSEDELLRLPNMGRKSVAEIVKHLEAKQLHLATPSAFALKAFNLRLLLSLPDLDSEIAALVRDLDCAYVGQVAALHRATLKKFMRRSSTQPSTALENIEEFLGRLGLRLGIPLPTWLVGKLDDFARVFESELGAIVACVVNELGESEVAEVGSTNDVELASVATLSCCLEEELAAVLPPTLDDRQKNIIATRMGWDGGPGLTLEESGQRFGLTRERIRQIEKKLEDQGKAGGESVFLQRALTIMDRLAPCKAEIVESSLVNEGVCRKPFRIEGLMRAANFFGFMGNSELRMVGNARFLAPGSFFEKLRVLESGLRREVSHLGFGRLSHFTEGASPEDLARIVDFLDCLDGLVWLDEAKDSVFLPTKRNTLINRLEKILRVVSCIGAELACRQICRDRRMQDLSIDAPALLRLVSTMSFCRVENGRIFAAESTRDSQGDDLDLAENRLVQILRDHGSVMDSRPLKELALSAGISVPRFQSLLADSCLIVQHGYAMYGIVGSSPPEVSSMLEVDQQCEHQSVDETAALQHVEAEAMEPTSILLSLNVRDQSFPLQVCGQVVRRAIALRGDLPWSISEVLISSVDKEALLRWGEVGVVDERWLRARSQRIHGLLITGYESLALTFLAYCSEVTRQLASEGEMWREIRGMLSPSLAEELFFTNGQTKPHLRDSTESVCRRLHIRHAFGNEGEQSWLRTVYLQFGITRSGLRRLSFWLCGYNVPLAVRDLCNPQHHLYSESFGMLWNTLQEYRFGVVEVGEVTEIIKSSCWVGAGWLPEVLSGAIDRRDLQRATGDSSITEDPLPQPLIEGIRLTWSGQPSFQLRIGPNAPDWIEDGSYVLTVSDGQRVPLTKRFSEWTVGGINNSVLLGTENHTVAIDLLYRRVSVLREMILVDLRPENMIGAFRLGDGKALEVWNATLSGSVVLLHPSDTRLSHQPTDFRRIFGGSWQLSAFREGIPVDLAIEQGAEVFWNNRTRTSSESVKSAAPIEARFGVGEWGETVSVVLSGLGGIEPRRLVVGSQFCDLTVQADGRARGTMTLLPELEESRTRARLVGRENGRVRTVSVKLFAGPVTGAAIEVDGCWRPLSGTEDLTTSDLKGRFMFRAPARWHGDDVALEDWAVLEGDHFCGRPRNGQSLGRSLYGLGDRLDLAVGPYNFTSQPRPLARSVVDTGLIRSAVLANGLITVTLVRDIELSTAHQVWIWYADESTPVSTSHSDWTTSGAIVEIRPAKPNIPISVGVSFEGEWLGSKILAQESWELLAQAVSRTDDWETTAKWLRWFRCPLLMKQLRPEVRRRVRLQPVVSFSAWTMANGIDSARFSELYEESWMAVLREYLWDWEPTPVDSASILIALGVLPEDPFLLLSEGWHNCEKLLRIDPVLFVKLACRSLVAAYSTATDSERKSLLRRLLEQFGGSSIERSLEDFAGHIGVDQRFLKSFLLADSQRKDVRSRGLRVAIGAQPVQRYLLASLLERSINS